MRHMASLPVGLQKFVGAAISAGVKKEGLRVPEP